ncbi:MAG: non-homologous end-joining DNA ligase [Nitrososphaera sp.]
MTLHEYKHKRNFAKTPEPGARKVHRKKAKLLRFVVQRHEATRLHYDFRLETKNGLLRSWAVPKGPTLDPKVKRLAILTEDHPGDYIHFEGKIPKGNYGAGTVIVWDTGDYSIDGDLEEQFKDGNIKIILRGKKLKGSFHLVRLKDSDKQWLVIKTRDEFCSTEDITTTMPESVLTGRTNAQVNRKLPVHTAPETQKGSLEDFPTSVKPMLAVPVDKPFDNKDWVFEIKWDGVRSILFLNKSKNILEIQARSGMTITHRYPEIEAIAKSAVQCENSVVLDGEIVVLNSEGAPDFQRHQKRMNVDSKKDIESLSQSTPSTYFVFDILHLDGRNLKQLEFLERRAVLSRVLRARSPGMRISDYIEEWGKAVFDNAVNMKLEGVVGKQKYGKYLEGVRSPSWVKIKSAVTQDCVVIGYTRGEGNREGYFGSLILAAYAHGKLRFIGHSGSGFTSEQLQEIFKKLERLKTERCPIDFVPYVNREPVWAKPKMVAEVKFNGWTQDQIMRAPIFVRLRGDKSPEECAIEVPKETQRVVMQERPPRLKEYAFSNLQKVYWPAMPDHRALKKRDLVEYYDRVSQHILPHLRNRPLSLSRYPDGITGKSFYNKHWDQAMPANAKTVHIFSEPKNDIINCLVCNNKETLLWLASLGCIEMHAWYSRVLDISACKRSAMAGNDPDPADEQKCGLDTPDFIIFDLDPYIYSGREKTGSEPEYNEKGFKAAVDVAFDLKDLFARFKIESYIKTSGKTGLHIFVPVAPIYSYKQTRDFAQIVGRMLRREDPDKVSMEWNTVKRKGKVFFDYNQNAKGKTVASVLSARPTVSATVSMPVKWNNLDRLLPTDFTILNVPEILRKNDDPWSDILRKKQDLAKILENTRRLD